MSESTLDGPDARILADTFWTAIPGPVLQKLVHGARVRAIPARGSIYGLADTQARAGILLGGSARAFLAAADGRQLSVRYARRGALIARRSRLLGGHSPVAVHAVTDVSLLELDAAAFLRLVETEVSVATAVLAELGRRLEDAYATVADTAFGSARDRIVRHLLAAAEPVVATGPRLARLTRHDLAEGTGSTHGEVDAALHELETEGSIAASADAIELLDPVRLAGRLGSWQVAAAGIDPTVEQDVEAILEATPSAVVAVDPGGEIRYVNSLAEATFGWGRAEVLGRDVEILIPEPLRSEHVSQRASFVGDPVPRPLYLRSGLRARRRDGTHFPVSVGLTAVDTRAGAMILATVIDRSGG